MIRRDERTGILVVMTDAVPGDEETYHDWYEREHLDDVLRVPGVEVGQRFVAVPGLRGALMPQRYLALYELSGDVDAALEAMRRTRDDRPTSPTLEPTSATSYAFRAIGPPHGR